MAGRIREEDIAAVPERRQIDEIDGGFIVRRATYAARTYAIEPDASSASYPFALAAATGGTITGTITGPIGGTTTGPIIR